LSNLSAVDVQAANQRTKVVGVLQGLNLSDLRRKGNGCFVACNHSMTLQSTGQRSVSTSVGVHVGLASSATGNEVGDIHGEAVDHADLAVTKHAGSVTHELGLSQVRLHQDLTLGGGDDQPAVGLGHVVLIQHAGQSSDA